jgi:hypothetical protein
LLVHAVAEPDLSPVVVDDALPAARLAGPHPGVVVLHTAVDAIRIALVEADGVELANREVVDAAVGGATVPALVQTRVAGQVEVLRIRRVDP